MTEIPKGLAEASLGLGFHMACIAAALSLPPREFLEGFWKAAEQYAASYFVNILLP